MRLLREPASNRSGELPAVNFGVTKRDRDEKSHSRYACRNGYA